MYYVEFLSARNRLGWFSLAVVLVGMVAVTAVRLAPQPAAALPSISVSFNVILLGASWFACIMATLVAGTLSRDYCHLPYMWTRPVHRERIALEYVAVDVAAIVVAFALLIVVTVVSLDAMPRLHVIADGTAWPILLRALAVPLMWYGLVEVATSWNGARARAMIGISWGLFWVLAILDGLSFPGILGKLFIVLNIINPMAYLPQAHTQDVDFQVGVLGLPSLPLTFNEQTLLVFAIFAVSCIVAIYAWKRMEA
ncbi:MAG TPA: hypothetical protein VMD07_05425 [Candidatus Acidoferrales bacterium]|nr:hypothetical protein [Candidatus Acidoferrales bacterium]